MKNKLLSLSTVLGVALILWPVFRSDFTNTQFFLSAIFSYLGIRLFIYIQKNEKPMN